MVGEDGEACEPCRGDGGWACDVFRKPPAAHMSVILLQVASSSNWRGKGFQATPTLRRGPSSGTTPNTNSQGTHRNLGGHQMTLPSLHAFAGIARVSRPEKLSNTPDLLVMTRGGCSCELPSWPRPGDTPCVFDGHRSERFTFSRQFQQQCAKSSKACTCSYLVIFNIKMPGYAWSQYTSICWQPTSNLPTGHDFLQHHHGLWTSNLELKKCAKHYHQRPFGWRDFSQGRNGTTQITNQPTIHHHHHHHHRHRHHPSCHARPPFACLGRVSWSFGLVSSLHPAPHGLGWRRYIVVHLSFRTAIFNDPSLTV